MGGGGTDTESVLGWECTWGVEKAQYLQKLCNIKGRSREAGHKRIFTMLLQRGRKKKGAVSSASSPLCLGRVSLR